MNETAQPFPNFFILGVPKAGTTSLSSYLNQHPDVFLPKEKEPKALFYRYADGEFQEEADQIVGKDRRSMAHYNSLFESAGTAHAVGESSFYLYSQYALETLQKLTPKAKFIIIFRNPVDRAYSNYLHLRRTGEEPIEDFRVAIAREDARDKNLRFFMRYRESGLYTRHLKRYFSAFPHEQFYIQLYEHWNADNQRILREIFTFLDVDANVPIDLEQKFQVGSEARLPALGNFLHHQPPLKQALEKIFQPILPKSVRYGIWTYLRDLNSKPAPRIDPQTRAELAAFYREDILELQELIGMDLSAWLEGSA